MLFVVTTAYVPAETERRLAARPAHREWLSGLKEQGRIISSGPFDDGLGACLIFDVADAAALDELLAQDPLPPDTFHVVSTRAWTPLFPF